MVKLMLKILLNKIDEKISWIWWLNIFLCRCLTPKQENNIFKFKRLTEVEKDAQYYIIVTTQNGLYRYFINDIVEVTGWYNNTPTIRFVQKGRGVTNLTGEKLHETQVTDAVMNMMEDMNATFEFFIMIAHRESLQYTLYVQHENIAA